MGWWRWRGGGRLLALLLFSWSPCIKRASLSEMEPDSQKYGGGCVINRAYQEMQNLSVSEGMSISVHINIVVWLLNHLISNIFIFTSFFFLKSWNENPYKTFPVQTYNGQGDNILPQLSFEVTATWVLNVHQYSGALLLSLDLYLNLLCLIKPCQVY